MRDWGAHVKGRLGSLRLDTADAEDVAGELAGHLEEFYEALLAEGLAEKEAYLRTCAEAGNWEELRRGVISAKQEGTMQERVGQIWLPSLVTLFTAWGILAIFMWAGIRPVTWGAGEPSGVILYLPWFLLLPVIGATGAYLSRRAQGASWRAYVSGAFPAVAALVVFAVVFPFAFAVDRQVVPFFKISSLVANVVSWVILPGIALCIGVALEGLVQSRKTLD